MTPAASGPITIMPTASRCRSMKARKTTLRTAMVMTVATRIGVRGAAITPHSIDSSETATATRIRNGRASNQPAQKATTASTAPDAARTPRLFQSKRLARGKYVIGGDSAVAPLPAVEFRDRGFQLLGPVVGPVDVLENQFGVGALPE